MSRKNTLIKPGHLSAFFFLLPAIILFSFFSWRPIIFGFWLAFHNYPIMPNVPPKYVGLENFRTLLADPLFYQSWLNTLLFVVLALLIGYFVPILLAIAINEIRRGASFFRLGFYLPVIIPIVVIILIWKFLYSAEDGLFDSVLQMLGLKPVKWLINKHTAMLSLVIMSTWKNAGGTMIIYLAALQSIPPQLYEAAEIDGASIWQRLRHITLPQLVPIMLILLILQILGTIQVFVEPFIMTQGGPGNATLTILLHIYNTAFRKYDLGLASALSLTIFTVCVIITVVYFISLKKLRQE